MENQFKTHEPSKLELNLFERIIELGRSTLKFLGLSHPDHTSVSPKQAAGYRASIGRSLPRD